MSTLSDEHDAAAASEGALGDALAGVLGLTPETDDNDPDEALVGAEEVSEEIEGEGEEGEDEFDMSAKGLAEALDVDAEFLYGVEYSVGDGEAMTAGEMKDELIKLRQGGTAVQDEMVKARNMQQYLQAQNALSQQYGKPIERADSLLRKLSGEYNEINWKSAVDEYGSDAMVKKLTLESQIREVQGDLQTMNGEYDQAMAGYAGQVKNNELQAMAAQHPEFKTFEEGVEYARKVYDGLESPPFTFEQMGEMLMSQGGARLLPTFEAASKMSGISNIDAKRVRGSMKTLRGGRSISKAQQRKMQAGRAAKALELAKGGTRQQRDAAAMALINQAGGL